MKLVYHYKQTQRSMVCTERCSSVAHLAHTALATGFVFTFWLTRNFIHLITSI